MPTRRDKTAEPKKQQKRKRSYKAHPLRERIGDFNAEALFVGLGGDFTYDGAILGTAERTVCERDVIVVDTKAPKAEVDKLIKHGLEQAALTKWALSVGHHRETVTVVVYSRRLIVELGAQKMLDAGDYTSADDAHAVSQEWHDFNTFCAWHGENTPMFVEDYPRE